MNGLPEVEPLGDVRWTRIEQSLMQRLDDLPSADKRAPATARSGSKARVWPIALAATVAVSAAAAVALHVTRPPFSASTSRVVTEASPSHVTFADNSLDVSPESGIVVREEDHATVLTLERGEVSLHVAPREKDRPFLVEAGDVHVRVVGTEFTVRRVGVGATVSVRKGVVEVREHGDLAVLRAGDRWPSEAAPPPPPATSNVPSTPDVPQAPVRPWDANTSSSAVPPSVPPRVSSLRSAPHARPSVDYADPPPALGAPPVPPPDAPSPLPASAPTPQSRYEAAAQLERSDSARALQIYTQLAQGSDAWAQNALYAAGRLQADRGARTDAERLLEEYLRRFPRGSNAEDARALRESLRSSR